MGQSSQYVGPYRLEKTLGKGQTGRSLLKLHRDVQDVDVGGAHDKHKLYTVYLCAYILCMIHIEIVFLFF